MPSSPRVSLRRRLARLCERACRIGYERFFGRRPGGRGGATILVYHSIADAAVHRWIDPRNATCPEVFAAQVRFLAAHRRVVPLTELAAALEAGRTLAPGSVVITFDDGYRDNYKVAAPILAHYGLPATFFLATGCIDEGSPQWVDELHSIYLARTVQVLRLGDAQYDLADQRDVDRSYAIVDRMLLETDAGERGRLLAALRQQLRPALSPPRLMLDWQEVRMLLAMHPGFQIGVHTRNHVSLPTQSHETVVAELTRCVADARTRTGVHAEFFSFPYGRSSRAARQQVAARFRAAVVTTPPALVHGGTDRYALPRIGPPDDARMFRFCTSGADPALVRRSLRGA
jgi:peptidoglycan/xylan/chitin deacetylase (PgdA/CDA1 family)